LSQEEANDETDKEEVIVAEPHLMVFMTKQYRIEQRNGEEKLVFDPRGKPQEEKRPVSIQGCYDLECEKVSYYHTHDTVGGIVVTYDPLAQTIGRIPARLTTLDTTEEWEQVSNPEDGVKSEGESDQGTEDDTEEARIYVTRVARNWIRVSTKHWRNDDCEGCPLSNGTHHHVVFDPDIEAREDSAITHMTFCQDWECRGAPNIHAHGSGVSQEIIPIDVSAATAREVWGTENPTMHHLKNTREPPSRGKAVIDGRAEATHPYGYFSCANQGCYLYYKSHQHTWNVDPDEPSRPIARGRYWHMIENGARCADLTCQHQTPHIHSKNEQRVVKRG
jgi:hypothetical protein